MLYQGVSIYVGPLLGTNSVLEWGFPDLEFLSIPTHNHMGVPILKWGPPFGMIPNAGVITQSLKLEWSPFQNGLVTEPAPFQDKEMNITISIW